MIRRLYIPLIDKDIYVYLRLKSPWGRMLDYTLTHPRQPQPKKPEHSILLLEIKGLERPERE